MSDTALIRVDFLIASEIRDHFDETANAVLTSVLLHGSVRRHSVEELELLAVFNNQLASRFVVAGEHTSEHDKVGSGTKSLGDIALK